MQDIDMVRLREYLECARIFSGAEMERLCNHSEWMEACIFQSIRDSIAQNIELLDSYTNVKNMKGETL